MSDYLVEAVEVRRYMIPVTQAASAEDAANTLAHRLQTHDIDVELGAPAEISVEVGAAYERPVISL
jgi:hypothetical protein